MNINDLDLVLEKQKEYFNSGVTLDVNFRIEMLKKLYKAIKDNEKEIEEALYQDLGKSDFESFLCEIGLVLSEISFMIKNVKKLSKNRKVKTDMVQFPSVGYKKPSPYGNVLIMSPWNYPFLLTIDPVVDAIAAGNTVVVKPSAYSPATSMIVKELLQDVFDEEYVAVVTGGREENKMLLSLKFDFYFPWLKFRFIL